MTGVPPYSVPVIVKLRAESTEKLDEDISSDKVSSLVRSGWTLVGSFVYQHGDNTSVALLMAPPRPAPPTNRIGLILFINTVLVAIGLVYLVSSSIGVF